MLVLFIHLQFIYLVLGGDPNGKGHPAGGFLSGFETTGERGLRGSCGNDP
jgi:hypothetical protein